MSWHTLLVLGGTGSGKTGYAESLLAGAPAVRRLEPPADADLAGLASVLADAEPDEVLLVDDLAGWLPTGGSGRKDPDVGALTAAVTTCPARLVLVSSEVGMATPPSTAGNRRLVEWLGTLNHALAQRCDAVVLVVAGQPSWLKPDQARVSPSATGAPAAGLAAAGPPVGRPAAGRPAADGTVGVGTAATTATATTATAAPVPTGAELADLTLADLTALPTADQPARRELTERLAGLGAVGLGTLAEVARFAAGSQGTATPTPWRQIQVLVLDGAHRGGASAGPQRAAERARALPAGTDPVALLAAPLGASVRVVATAGADPIEDGPAMSDPDVEAALVHGWQLAGGAVDEGVDLLVLGSIGDGAETAAAAVAAVLAPGSEPAGLLGRVRTPQGTIDDRAWIQRCAAVRDAVHRTRSASRTSGRSVLAELGGPDLAVATGVLLGAAARRTPVLLDGPVGCAAALVAKNLATAARHWWLLPDTGGHPLVTRVRETLGLTPLLDLGLELGEGANALAVLPLLRSALWLADTLPAGAPAAD